MTTVNHTIFDNKNQNQINNNKKQHQQKVQIQNNKIKETHECKQKKKANKRTCQTTGHGT